MLQTAARLSVTIVVAAALGGCVARRPAAVQVPEEGLAGYIGKVRELSVRAKPTQKHVFGVTAESMDPRLSAALLTLATVPSGEAHRLVAGEYARLAILDAALDHYRRATRFDRRDAAAYEGMARVWRDWGLAELGLGDATRATYFAPTSASASNTLGTLLHALGQRDGARRAYQRAAALDPKAAYAFSNLCYVSMLDGQVSAAEAQCRSALAIDPDMKTATRNMALVYARGGRIDLAWEALQQVDAPPTASYNLGIINLARDDRAGALVAFESACRRDPTVANACDRARQLRQHLRSIQ